ncbi:MAG: zf-HC2 domain-containing protein [Bacteroidota bacterium]
MEGNNGKKAECEKFLNLVQLLIDNETNHIEETYIKEHIDECAPCFKQMEMEKEFKELVRQKIEKKQVPQELITAIETKIKALVSPA